MVVRQGLLLLLLSTHYYTGTQKIPWLHQATKGTHSNTGRGQPTAQPAGCVSEGSGVVGCVTTIVVERLVLIVRLLAVVVVAAVEDAYSSSAKQDVLAAKSRGDESTAVRHSGAERTDATKTTSMFQNVNPTLVLLVSDHESSTEQSYPTGGAMGGHDTAAERL